VDPLWALLAAGVTMLGLFVVVERVRSRGAKKVSLEPPPAGEAVSPRPPRAPPPPRGPPPIIAATDWGGVFLESGSERLVLCLLPVARGALAARLAVAPRAGAIVEALIVVNDPALGGDLFATTAIERLGLDRDAVFATDPNTPIDRGPASSTRHANALPRRLRRGIVEVRQRRPGVLECKWQSNGEWFALVGAGIPLDAIAPPLPTFIVGSFAIGAGDSPVSSGGAPPVEIFGTLRAVTLLATVPPRTAPTAALLWSTFGVNTNVVGAHDVAEDVVTLLREGKTAEAKELLREAELSSIEHTLVALIARGDLALAAVLAELALETTDGAAPIWFQRGVLLHMSGTTEEAEAAYREALARGYALAAMNLASMLRARGERAAALELAEKALEAHPDDPLVLRAGIAARADLGDVEGARAALVARGDLLSREERAVIERELAAGTPYRARPGIDGAPAYPMHAKMMCETGEDLATAGDHEGAARAFERAIELDAGGLHGYAGLGHALSSLGKDLEAIAVYDRGIERAIGGPLLGFNRGNALRRLERLDDALAAYRRIVELVPEWIDPRVNLASVLQAMKRLDEARAEIEEIERRGAPPELVALLRESLASAH
jgi:tetratricopeptide (TPR) repeat protein